MIIGEEFKKVKWNVLIFRYEEKKEYTWKTRVSSDDAAKIGYTCIIETTSVFPSSDEAKKAFLKWKREKNLKEYEYVEAEEW